MSLSVRAEPPVTEEREAPQSAADWCPRPDPMPPTGGANPLPKA